MKMAYVDGVDQVIVVHTGGVVRAYQGICTHEYFELDKGFLTGGGSQGPNGEPAGTLTCALHLSRFDLGTGEASTRRPSCRSLDTTWSSRTAASSSRSPTARSRSTSSRWLER